MERQLWIIDLKVYSIIDQMDIPGIMMPPELLSEAQLRPGLYQLVWNTTVLMIDQFAEVIADNAAVKLLGAHHLETQLKLF